ncbi:SH3 domain-containing protein [Bacillus sp. B190/17]|uniref:SH3 domain-containing protein n=1 Tax=Bacillus lumedeiriae TaxID=3058829 RepID=A0ABW8ICA1_9BACI
MKKFIAFFIAFVLLTTLVNVQQTEASTVNKHFTVNVKKLDVRVKPSPKAKIAGSLKSGTVVFVYNTEPGGWSKVKYNNKAGYIATSGLKTTNNAKPSPVKSFKNYEGEWYTSSSFQPGMGVNLKFIGDNKANIDLYGVWWSRPDGSNVRESDAYGYTITFDKNGVGKVKFTESYGLNTGIATVKLVGSYVYVKIEYPWGIDLDSYIYEGNHKLVRAKF